MIRLLQFLFFGHWHKWKTLEEGNYYESRKERESGALPIGRVYYQQCEHCGKVIKRTLT